MASRPLMAGVARSATGAPSARASDTEPAKAVARIERDCVPVEGGDSSAPAQRPCRIHRRHPAVHVGQLVPGRTRNAVSMRVVSIHTSRAG